MPLGKDIDIRLYVRYNTNMMIDKMIKTFCLALFLVSLSSCVTYIQKGYNTNNPILFYERDNKGNYIKISNSIYITHYLDTGPLFYFDILHDRNKNIDVGIYIETNNYSNVQFIQINEFKAIINGNIIDILDDAFIHRMEVRNNVLQSFPKLHDDQIERLDDNKIKIKIYPNDLVGIKNHVFTEMDYIKIDYLKVRNIKVIAKFTIMYNDNNVEKEFEKIFRRRTIRTLGFVAV
jgi:hypothetical protein